MSYNFEAEPKVVVSRSKYRNPAAPVARSWGDYVGSSSPLITKDNRIKLLNPLEQEEEYVRLEKDRIKQENMHTQLSAFKKNSKKASPYEIKPSPKPKVKVNLEFFLTDSTDLKPVSSSVDIQTDGFKEKPKSPPYVPKKTGRDAYTQVEDNELFDFDREVTPIVDVIVTKTMEQSIIEIEEEEEMHRIKQFKEEYWKRRQDDDMKWKAMVQKELYLMAEKDKRVQQHRNREDKRIAVLRKLQAYQIANTYLRDVKFNAQRSLYENGFYQNKQQEDRINKVPPFFVKGVIEIVGEKQKIKEQLAGAFNHIEQDLQKLREKADMKFKRQVEKRKLKRMNYSRDERIVRFIYMDEYPPSTYFSRFLAKTNEQDLIAYFEDYRNKVKQLKERLTKAEITQEEYTNTYTTEFPELQPQTNLRISLEDLNVLSFNVANNMYYNELPKKGFFDLSISAFDKEGNFLYQVDKNNSKNGSRSIRYLGNVRDTTLKISDDLGIKVNLRKIEADVGHLIMSVDIRSLEQSIAIYNDFLKYSRFRLAEFVTDQTIEDTSIFQNFKLEELKDPNAESELGGKILCYYLHRDPELGWMFESVKTYKNVPVDSYAAFNKVIERYLKACIDEDIRAAEGSEPNSSPEQSFDAKITKDTKPTGNAKDAKDAKDAKGKSVAVSESVIESEKEEEEVIPKFNSRTFGPLRLKTDQSLEEMQSKIEKAMEKESPDLLKSFRYGYEITVDGKELVRPTQIRKIGKVTSFLIKRKPKPVEIVAEQVVEQGDQEDKNSEKSD